MAKTQYSFSTDPKQRNAPTDHLVKVREVRLSAGAEFVVVIAGEIMTMPGLPRVPSANAIRLNDKGQVEGLFQPPRSFSRGVERSAPCRVRILRHDRETCPSEALYCVTRAFRRGLPALAHRVDRADRKTATICRAWGKCGSMATCNTVNVVSSVNAQELACPQRSAQPRSRFSIWV
jgi:hypothetical protein